MKSIVLGWIYAISAHLPPSMSIWVVNRSLPVGRPVLDYLEFHLADHCNLNCAGCTHFAPYADRRFADLVETRRDFLRLNELFSNIRHIRIMGGEPLLHSEAAEFVRMVHEAFPRSSVRLVTNGIKLLDGNDPGVAKALAALKAGRKDRILPVLLSGTPETAVPEEVRDLPLAADLRGEDLSYDRKKRACL